MEGPVLWFANRGTGVTLLVLLSLSTVLGVLASGRATHPRWPRSLTQALHRNVALLSCALLVAHVVTAVVDEFVDIRWWHAVVPFTATYERVWLGLGTLALDLILAVVVTSLLRRRMGHRPWRAVHLASYAAWWLGVMHGLLMGTDAGATWSQAVTWVCVAAVLAAAAYRIRTRPQTLEVTS